MNFVCVFSVSGSLATYQVQRESEEAYRAVLKMASGRRDDIPAEILLRKEGESWKSEPWHDEVANGLIQAIRGNGQ